MQINVAGFKQVESHSSDRIRVYRDAHTMLVRIDGSWNNLSADTTLVTTTLKPKANQVVHAHSNTTNRISVGTDGKVRYLGQTGTQSIYTSLYLPIA